MHASCIAKINIAKVAANNTGSMIVSWASPPSFGFIPFSKSLSSILSIKITQGTLATDVRLMSRASP